MTIIRNATFLLLATMLLFLSACKEERPVVMGIELRDGLFAKIETNKGPILCRLNTDYAPLTVANFVGLCEGKIPTPVNNPGECYYDGIIWHRVVPGFIIQAGDPNTLPNGNPQMIGMGGPGYMFKNEVSNELLHDKEGTLAMANSGPDTNGSQFYITHRATPNLDGGYSVFGYVRRGMETVQAIRQGDTIKTINIIRVGKEAQSYDPKKKFDLLK